MTFSPSALAILCIDDEPIVTNALRTLLSQKFQEIKVIETAQSGEEALEIIDELAEDGIELCAVVTDCIMPKMMGDELLIRIHQRLPHVKKIMLTGQSHTDRIVKAINEADLYRFIEKPWQNDDLILTLQGAVKAYLQTQALETRNQLLQKKSQDLESALLTLQHTQLKMVQSEKMSGLGQLSAGIAHEINNPISFIHGNIEASTNYSRDCLALISLYQKHYPNPAIEIQNFSEEIEFEFLKQDWQRLLASMQTGTQRVKKIVESLRNFSRLDEAQYKLVDLHEGLDSSLLLLNHRLVGTVDTPAIQVMKDYSELPLVLCHASAVNQVFINLLGNAIDALKENSSDTPPTITVTTYAEAARAIIKITDNGVGISEADQKKIFDPFFTTKPIGQGTGLGLTASYQTIVESHRGHLTVTSMPGEYTTFQIELPLVQ